MTERRITPRDEEWPPKLLEMGSLRAPKSLFVEGVSFRKDRPLVGIVGTRRPSGVGMEAAAKIARGLVEAGFGVVSGLAVGIDAVAHRACLDAGGYTVAVLGCGLDVDYPRRNAGLRAAIRDAGTVVTELERGIGPAPFNFPERNRIVAALSDGVLVIEGGHKSGALITARRALDANRHVWAMPGSYRNAMAAGPNELIRRGEAALVTDLAHILEDLVPQLVWESPADLGIAPKPPDLSDEEIIVLSYLDDAPFSPDHIVDHLEIPAGTAALALARLEVRAFIRQRGAGYELTEAGARARSALVMAMESSRAE